MESRPAPPATAKATQVTVRRRARTTARMMNNARGMPM